MRYGGTKLNNSHSLPYATAVGKFLMNFGSVELMSHAWIDSLSTDPLLAKLAMEMQFAKRVALIRLLVNRSSAPESTKHAALAEWGKAEKLSHLRNEIAHATLALGWNGADESGPPDFLGAFNMKKHGAQRPKPEKLVCLADLESKVSESQATFSRLSGILDAVVGGAAV